MNKLLALSLVMTSSAFAAENENVGVNMWDYLGVFGWLFVIIALMFGSAWLLKKSNMVSSGDNSIKVVSSLPFGQKERVALIEVEGERVLLGITSNGISMLRRYESIEDNQEPVDNKQFKARLAKALQERSKKQ